MDNVSRPLIALLVGSVAFLALWLVALKPSSSSTTGKPGGLGAYQSAINKAHQAASTANAASAAEGGSVVTTATSTGTAARPQAAPRVPVTHPAKVRPVANTPLAVDQALRKGKVVALLFYNPAATDDRAIRQELTSVPTHSGKVVKLAVPVSRLAQYGVVTSQVPVQVSPTLVLINKARQASTIVGFADRFEIDQRVADALP
jgi:ABC-type amino acid transport substrate-binding protein